MNRKETRQLKKKLGLNGYQKNLSRTEKFEIKRHNAIAGKKKQEENKNFANRQQNQKQDEIDNNKIASLATTLMIKENLEYIDALEKAKKTYKG